MKRASGARAVALAGLLVSATALVGVTACSDDSTSTPGPGGATNGAGGGAKPAGVAKPADATPLPVWVDVAEEAGITALNHSGKPAQKDWIVSGMGGGSIAFDSDGDGDMDLLIVDGTMLTSDGELQYDEAWRTRLFRNDGDWKFTDVTADCGIDVQAFGFGGASCDYDADGDMDVYLCTWGRNFLFRNRGDGTFEDVTDAAGVRGAEWDMSTACAFGDVDGDGHHDLYVSNYVDQQKQIEEHRANGDPGRICSWRKFNVYCGPPGLIGQLDRLYLGNGDGTFREVGEARLKDQHPRYAFQCVMTDVDEDGDLDIFVANDTVENVMWVNDGKGFFENLARQCGVATDADVKEQAGMGVAVADMNQDGLVDIVVTHFSHDHNTLYVNDLRKEGRPLFADRTHTYKLFESSYHRLCWGVGMFDMDNDADLDMWVACGHVYGEIDNFAEDTGTSYAQKNLLLRNEGAPRFKFEDVTTRSGSALQIERVWRGACFADFDDDGDIDVFATSLNGKPALCRNDGGNTNSWLRFALEGKGGQRDPSGARVYVLLESGAVQMEELHHGSSFCGDNDPRLHFGTGSATIAGTVRVVWPDGTEETFRDVATRKGYRIRQGAGKLEPAK